MRGSFAPTLLLLSALVLGYLAFSIIAALSWNPGQEITNVCSDVMLLPAAPA